MAINNQIRDGILQYDIKAKLDYYSPLGKVFEKQIYTIDNQGEKQIKALEYLKPKEQTKSME